MGDNPHSLEVFYGAVDIMLRDGVLTREEKRLVIKLANILGLEGDEPKRVYRAVVDGEQITGGHEMTHEEQLATYERVYEVALVDETLSQDEYAVLAYLRAAFQITDREHLSIEEHLRNKVEERYEAAAVDKMLHKLRESTGAIGRTFEGIVRRKPANKP